MFETGVFRRYVWSGGGELENDTLIDKMLVSFAHGEWKNLRAALRIDGENGS